MSEPAETSKASSAEPAGPPLRSEDSPSLPSASLPTPSHSLVDRVLDMVLPFRKGGLRREYKELIDEITRTEREIVRIERMRDTLAGPDSGLTASEQSVIFLRSELTGDDLTVRSEKLDMMRARVTELLAKHPDLAAD